MSCGDPIDGASVDIDQSCDAWPRVACGGRLVVSGWIVSRLRDAEADVRKARACGHLRPRMPGLPSGAALHYALILWVLEAAAAKIASTLSGAKNSVGDIVPAFRRAKPSMAAWLP